MHKLCWFNPEANLCLVGFDQWHHFTAVQRLIVCNHYQALTFKELGASFV